MKFNALLILTLSTLLGCNQQNNNEVGYAYFGGEIINPNNDYIVLTGPDEISDTLYLDENNRFLKKIENLKPHIYTFVHGGEYQRVLVESGDSIMLRLNTLDFDESLVFTGNGARKNNYLISAFLDNETDNKKFMRMMWDMEPTAFEKALDSNRSERLADLKDFLQDNDYSDYFKTVAETNITYDYYFNKEMYPFGYFGYNNLIHFKDLPENFYDYRKDADYNNEELLGVIPYTRFLFWHFNNLALKKYYKTATHNVVFDKKSVSYNLEKLKLMDSLISNKTVKNHLLRLTTRDFISTSEDSLETQEVVTSFLNKTTKEDDKTYIKDYVEIINQLRVGKTIPNIELLNFNQEKVNLHSAIDKPTVIYFWSSNLPMLLRNNHSKANSLQSKFPEIDFIAVNINDDDMTRWKKTIQQYNFNNSNEYRFVNPNEATQLLALNSINKSIFVDGNGKIINSNVMMITSEFEDELQRTVSRTKKEALK